jgi:dienelactone hydrolase
MKLRTGLLAFLLLAVMPVVVRAQTVNFPSIAVGTSPVGPMLSGYLYRPAGAGPFPAIVLAHTCAGINEHTSVWGKRLASWGYVVLAPDSIGPRGERTLCGRGNAVSGNARVADVAGAIAYLNAQPFVRQNDIGLIGHSHGGWTVMRAVQAEYGLAARGLKAAVAYYPSCSSRADLNVAVPLLVMIGERDDWTSASDCHRLQAAALVNPSLVEFVYYPNAYHSFDNQAPDRRVTVADGKTHHLAYDPSGAPDAEARTRAFFAKYLH